LHLTRGNRDANFDEDLSGGTYTGAEPKPASDSQVRVSFQAGGEID
jgi:hypothetical protein